MGYYLQIDEDEPVMIASLIGWGDVIRWSHKLPPSDSGAIRHFCTFGWEDDFGKLKTEIKSCFAKQPPHDTATQETLQNLNDAVAKHKGDAAVVSITDGLGEQGGDAEDAAQTSPEKDATKKTMTPTSGRHSSLLTYAMMPYGTAYAIEPGAGRQIMALLQEVDMAGHIREHQAAAREARANAGSDAGEDAPGYEMNGSVAMLSLSGPLTKQVTSMQAMLGGTGMESFAEALAAAAADPAAQSIVIVADSPGGTVDGTEELYQCIRDAAAKKPAYIYIPDLCASAAYWAACGASAIYTGPTAGVGSVGVFAVVTDTSKAAAAAGKQVSVIGSGGMKGAGTPGTPVTDAQKADLQREIDDTIAHFVAAVAKGRKMPVAQARTLADGRVHIGAKAQALGLTDGTMRLSDLVAKIQKDPNAALPASTTHPNARMGNNNAQNTNRAQEKSMSKALLAGALASLGFLKMSGKAMAAPDDDPQALASAVASEMGAEVDAQVLARDAASPLMSALKAANITTPDALAALLQDAETGRASVSAVRKAAKEHAIIAFGAETAKTYAATIDALPAGDALSGYALHMKSEALKKAPEGGKQAQTLGTKTASVQYAQAASDEPVIDRVQQHIDSKGGKTAIGK